jgi:arylsulfatase
VVARPNILLIMTDQQRGDTLGASGNGLIHTPVLDRLCGEGVRFERCYTPSPVCVPARMALLTGLLPHRNGCVDNGGRLAANTKTLMQVLGDVGYVRHAVGKMHFSPPRASLGFDCMELSEEIPACPEIDDYLTFLHGHGFAHVHEPHGVRSDMYYIPQVSQLPAALHATAWTADRAAAFLRAHDQSRPFFLWVSFIKPHPPFDPPVPWNKLYRTIDMPPPFRPDGYQSLQTWWMRHQNRYKYREAGPDDTLNRTLRAAYYGSISFIDYHVGRILRALDATGLADRTLVIFTSDHGELLGDYGSWGKRTFLDAAARVPLIVRWPGEMPAGAVSRCLVSLLDIMPTVLAAAGVDPDTHHLDGADLRAVMTARADRIVLGQLSRGPRGTYFATDGRRKYMYSAPDDREYLFDLEVDPRETRNLMGEAGAAEGAVALRNALIERYRVAGYEEPLEGSRWRRFPVLADPVDADDDRIFQEAAWTDPWVRWPGYVQDWLPRQR